MNATRALSIRFAADVLRVNSTDRLIHSRYSCEHRITRPFGLDLLVEIESPDFFFAMTSPLGLKRDSFYLKYSVGNAYIQVPPKMKKIQE